MLANVPRLLARSRRSYATAAAAAATTSLPAMGDKLHGFTVLRTRTVPELELTALHLRHDRTGADYLHIARDDDNNVFSVGFKTNPPDDTGVPHILEHTTLCGSEKYPIRDPFFKMLPRTLANFMNAFTASDHTFYPFATTNAQDFQNMMSVYLDATLHPLLKETDFRQEGWRIGPENPVNPSTVNPSIVNPSTAATAAQDDGRLVFKGVVYNEMKGQMSDANYIFYIRFQDHIFPEINNSGGDPPHITHLTYQQLRNFHATHYHPSNAKFITYGNMPLDAHLRYVHQQISSFSPIERDPRVLSPAPLAQPTSVTLPGPMDPLVPADRQYKTSVSWVTGDTADVVESFSVSLLSTLLMDGYGSPLYRGLIESGYAVEFSPNSGYDSSAGRGIFSIGVTGVSEEGVPKLRDLVASILRDVRQKGFEKHKIDAAIHQLELALKHKTANFGVNLLNRVKSKWFNGADPLELLAWNQTLEKFQAKISQGQYLEGLMDKYLLTDNTFTFTMTPSETYAEELAEDEKQRLAAKLAEATRQLGSDEAVRQHFSEQEQVLLEEQNKTKTEDLDCLPTVHLRDIPRHKEGVLVHDELVDHHINIQWRAAPTNGITYFRAINVLPSIPDDLRPLVPLFSECLARLGTKTMDTEQVEDFIKQHTGGVSIGYHATPSPSDFRQAEEGISFSGMALDRNVGAMFEILHKLISDVHFEREDTPAILHQLLQASTEGIVNDIASSGHKFARGFAESGLTRHASLGQTVSGLHQVATTAALARQVTPDWDGVRPILEKLKAIQRLILGQGRLRVALTCDAGSVDANRSAFRSFLSSFPGSFGRDPQAPAPLSDCLPGSATSLKTFFPLPYQVFYGGLAVPTVNYTHRDGPVLDVLARLLTNRHLHHEIREKGGAYGGGAFSSGLGGLFGFYSYRDPNPMNTLSIMKGAGRVAVDKDWTRRDLEEAKISVFQALDAPRSVNEDGMARFVSGITDEMRQKRRELLLDATVDDVRSVAQTYLVDQIQRDQYRTAILGSKQEWVDRDAWEVRDISGETD